MVQAALLANTTRVLILKLSSIACFQINCDFINAEANHIRLPTCIGQCRIEGFSLLKEMPYSLV